MCLTPDPYRIYDLCMMYRITRRDEKASVLAEFEASDQGEAEIIGLEKAGGSDFDIWVQQSDGWWAKIE